jgi:hypothetical protein
MGRGWLGWSYTVEHIVARSSRSGQRVAGFGVVLFNEGSGLGLREGNRRVKLER